MRMMWTAIASTFLIFLCPFSGIAINEYSEDFSTQSYMDGTNTTALWDTGAGEIKLPPYIPTDLDIIDPGGGNEGIVVEGDYAYLACYQYGFIVVDISDPENLFVAGQNTTYGCYTKLALHGDYAFVADRCMNSRVFDISDPTNPTVVTSFPTVGAHDLAIAGDYLFVANHSGSSGLRVFDITDPTSPAQVADLGGFVWPRDIEIAGDIAYIVDSTKGLVVVDISDPESPVWVSNVLSIHVAVGLDVEGDYIYVADFEAGLTVFDVSDPGNPVIAGNHDTPGWSYRVAIEGDYAYLNDRHEGIKVLDVSDPTNPVLLYEIPTPFANINIRIAGEHAFVSLAQAGMQSIRIAEPVLPPLGVNNHDTPSAAYGVALAGNYAYVADDGSGLQVIDISDPSSPASVGSYDTPGRALGVALAGNYAYVADFSSGLQVIDISVPSNPAYTGNYNTPGEARGVAVAGNYAYVADNESGLQVIDISVASNPTYVGSYNTPGLARGIALAGDYAYVADVYSGLQVIDVSVPSNPTYAGSYDTPGQARDLTLAGNHAYVADNDFGLQVIDISLPSSPSFAGSYNTPGLARGVTLAGDYAYVADHSFGLQVIDISLPSSPSYLGTFDTPDLGLGLALAGDYVYVADNESGLQIIEVFQRSYDSSAKLAQSLALDSSIMDIPRARLSTTQANSILWELSADGGTNWDALLPGDPWHSFSVPGSDLRWRSMHTYTGAGVNPACTDLLVEWDYDTSLSVLPAASGPINCSQIVDLAFHYFPSSADPPLRGYSLTVGCSSSLSLDESDIIDSGILDGLGISEIFEVVDNGDGTFDIQASILGPTAGLTVAGDLFSINFHGAETGAADVQILSYILRDLDNADFFADTFDAVVDVDCTAPGKVEDIRAEPGHEKVMLSWSDPVDADLDFIEIWRGVWHDGAGASVYPEYDDDPGNTIPTRPADRAAADASSEWQIAGTANPGDEYFVDSFAPRGVYYYEIFARDIATNFGPPADENDRASNYWLADVAPSGSFDGLVDVADISLLGANYGTQDGDGFYDNEVDVGPTDDHSGFGIPVTDDVVNFEDLMIFALNFSVVGPMPSGGQGSEIAMLMWRRENANCWSLDLVDPCEDLKGLSLVVNLPDDVLAEVEPGALLDEQGQPCFLGRHESRDLNIGLALMGADARIRGVGELVRITLSKDVNLSAPELVLRSSSNENLDFQFGATSSPELPEINRLSQNYPNPFNPKTTIHFDLADEQAVEITVYNVEGRWLVTLVDEVKPAGFHSVDWDGRDREGRKLASGLYFYRLTVPGYSQIQKMLLLQ